MAPKIPLPKPQAKKSHYRVLKAAKFDVQGAWVDASFDVVMAMMVQEIARIEDERFVKGLTNPNAHWEMGW